MRKAIYPTKRIEVRTPVGTVALVRYGQPGRPGSSYRVSYKYGADHWAEYCSGITGPHAYRSFCTIVRFQRMRATRP